MAKDEAFMNALSAAVATIVDEERKEIDAELTKLRAEVAELRERLDAEVVDQERMVERLRSELAERQAQEPAKPSLTLVSGG